MTRGKKILINTCIIAILLLVCCYFGGFYFSKEACAKAVLGAHQREKEEVILDLDIGDNRIIVLCGGQFDNQYSQVELKKIGFLYRSHETLGTFRSNPEKMIGLGGWAGEDDGQVIFIKRNNPEIATIEVEFEDGRTLSLDRWSQDFTSYHLDVDMWLRGHYQYYDANGNLIGEMEY